MEKHLKRQIGPWALLFTGLGSIIGSGWLFGAWKASQIAGPAAVLAWLVGACVMLAIALTFTELGAMFPESGGMVRYSRYSHGALVGFVSAWANWIALVAVVPIEAEASVQYMGTWPWAWARALFANGELTAPGLALAAVLVVVYFLLNYWGVRLFARANAVITLFKFAVPALTAAALLLDGFHAGNFTGRGTGGFAPFGWDSLLTAIATGGVVFSFNGFQSPVNLAGEAENPGRNVPLAVVGSILLAALIYTVLQVAFVGAVSPADLHHGWRALDFSSPFAQLALALNLNWLALVLYLDAFVSPSGTGATFMATTTRMVYAMERNGTFPRIFGRVHPLYGVPRPAMWLNLALAFAYLFFFRGWGALVAVFSVSSIVSFLTGPVSVLSLRRDAPEWPRPLRIAGLGWLAPFAFVCASLVLYWGRWPLTGQVILVMLAALPIFLYYQSKAGWTGFSRDLNAAWWLILYLPALALLSWLGSANFGGRDYLPYGWDLLAVVGVALLFFHWGVRSGWRTASLDAEAGGNASGKD